MDGIKMEFIFPVLDHYGGPVLFLLFITLYILEFYYTLRMPGEKKSRRLWRNGKLAVVGFTVVRLAVIPAMVFTAHWAGKNNVGIFNWLELDLWIEYAITFLLLDYSMYIWHRMNHRIPVLWRFHNVHHTDLQLDITTAIRFHFGEMFFSVFFRSFVVLMLGAHVWIILIYEIFFQAATAFHHSNLKLPYSFDKRLVRLIVTPRMHGIHHSIYKNETDSNYATIFAFWDHLHKTKVTGISQDSVTIGVPGWRDIRELHFPDLLKLPFIKQREWRLPDGGRPLVRKTGSKDFTDMP